MINWIDVMVARQMREDALAHAEKERLVRQVQGRRPWPRERYRLRMAQLGDRLIAWGQRLKARYAVEQIAWNAPEGYCLEGSSDRCMC